MTLYHGSDQIIKNPELRPSIRTLDFGAGFYTTTNKEQAANFAVYIKDFWRLQMADTEFKATLEMLIPLVIREIMKNRNVNEREAFELLYSSFMYSKLETESTKLWHLSQLTLANLLNEEIETGTIIFPEEA
jgi:hypothetical protein